MASVTLFPLQLEGRHNLPGYPPGISCYNIVQHPRGRNSQSRTIDANVLEHLKLKDLT